MLLQKKDNALGYDRKLEVVLNYARKIKEAKNKENVHYVVKALLYPVMYRLIYDGFTMERGSDTEYSSIKNAFPLEMGWESKYSKPVFDKDNPKYIVDLEKDIIFTFPWYHNSIVSTSDIGCSKKFQQDSIAHSITILGPLRICLVNWGNHSIMYGILAGEGKVIADEYIDLSPVLHRYSYNGTCWVDNTTGEKKEVKNHNIALAWEVSKLML